MKWNQPWEPFFRVCLLIVIGAAAFELSACSKRETTVQSTPAPIQSQAATSPIALSRSTERTEEPDATVAADADMTPSKEAKEPETSDEDEDSSSTPDPSSEPKLQNRIDELFSEGWKDLNRQYAHSSILSSIDFREQVGSYVVRTFVPDTETSRLFANVEDGALHISSPGQQVGNGPPKTKGSDQIIRLPSEVQSEKMKVDRKGNVVVITIPKTTVSTALATSAKPKLAQVTGSTSSNEGLLDEMTRLKGRIDKIFASAFPNDQARSANVSRLGGSVDVDEQKDKYVVHFYSPDRDVKDVEVKFKDRQIDLVMPETGAATNNAIVPERTDAGFEQKITLSQPVKENEMKVDRTGSTVTVTLPKA